ncbi:MAG: hypothetical protein JSS27_08290 [Planctomycetes bacterium]|nr:hypothetical protein [Planctomycetota bacterium]
MKSLAVVASLVMLAIVATSLAAQAAPPAPAHANISYGPHPDQLIDIYVPTNGSGPYPVLVWYGGLWKPAKHAARLDYFLPAEVAVVAVQLRTMTEAVQDKQPEPVKYIMDDACRAVQFVRLNASKWNLNGQRIAVGGGSQGALPALYVGCSADRANPKSDDPVARASSRVTCVAAYRSQPTIDPQLMQQWEPGVKWGAPALGVSFEESLKRRDELLPIIKRWSPDALLHAGAAPMYFENEWGLIKPDDIEEVNYKVHSPHWGLGFQKLALAAGAKCHVKYPGHPTEGYDDIWGFLKQNLKSP